MANNVAITAGSGTAVATDDAGSAHYQVVKLADGTEDSTVRIVAGGGVEASALRVTIASDSTGLLAVGGSVAHDSADSGKPVKIGGKARTTNPTAVSDADRVDATFDDIGRIVVVPHQVRDLVATQATTITNSTTETTIVTAAASTFHDLVHLTLTNASATAVVATLRDATGAGTACNYALAANGGITLAYPTPKKQGTVNTNWTVTLSVNTVTVYIVAEYIKNV